MCQRILTVVSQRRGSIALGAGRIREVLHTGEKEMKLEEIPNLSVPNSMREEKGFVRRPEAAFSNSSRSSALKIQSTGHKRPVRNWLLGFSLIVATCSGPLLIFSKWKMEAGCWLFGIFYET